MFWCAIAMHVAMAASPSGEIAYVAVDEAKQQVCLLELASGEVRAVGPGRLDGPPVWSPDGHKLAFSTERNGGRSILVIDLETGDEQYLSGAHSWNERPRWSTDGTHVAYEASAGPEAMPCLAVHDFDTEALWADGREGFLRPVWLPNLDLKLFLDPKRELAVPGVDLDVMWTEAERYGAVLALALPRDGRRTTTEIVVVTKTQVMPLLLDMLVEDSERFVEWNCVVDRKGRQVAFESNDGGDREIYLLGNRGLVNLSNHRRADWDPVWSPRSNWLAFTSFRDGRQGVYTVYTKTAKVNTIACRRDADTYSPTWSLDGDWLAYVSDDGETARLCVRASEGEAAETEYDVPSPRAIHPAWRPKVKP